jgi:hypothetical protein
MKILIVFYTFNSNTFIPAFSRGCVTFFLLFEGAGGPHPAGAGGGGRESHPPSAAQGPRQRQVKNLPFIYQKLLLWRDFGCTEICGG